MGSLVARAVLAYDGLSCFRSGGETTSEVGCSHQWRGLENSAGSEALTGEGCQGGQSKGAVVAPSSFRCSCARKKGEGVRGCCGRDESKREATDGGAHWHGALGGGEAEAAWNRAVRASARKR
jgi:hypothetical protein